MRLRMITAVLIGATLTGCAGIGLIYTAINPTQAAPIIIENRVQDGIELGSKRGTACLRSFLGLFSFGDASMIAAAEDGGIKRIKTAHTDITAFLVGVYFRSCTIVTGE